MPELEAKFLWKQVVHAIYYCHEIRVTHRDIKLENILLDETKTVVKLIDFGFSTCIPHDRMVKIFCGTPSYMAPEQIRDEHELEPEKEMITGSRSASWRSRG